MQIQCNQPVPRRNTHVDIQMPDGSLVIFGQVVRPFGYQPLVPVVCNRYYSKVGVSNRRVNILPMRGEDRGVSGPGFTHIMRQKRISSVRDALVCFMSFVVMQQP